MRCANTGQGTRHDEDRSLRATSDIGPPALTQEKQQRDQRTAWQKHLQHEIWTRFLSDSPQFAQPAHDDLHGSLPLAFEWPPN
jgi:hypothetical protein